MPDEKEISRIREEIAARNPSAVMLYGYETAIIGVTVERSPRAVYSMERMRKAVPSGGLEDVPEEEAQDEALEYLDYNILGGMEGIDEKVRPVIVDTSIVG